MTTTPGRDDDFAFRSLTEISRAIRAGEISSVALTRLMLDRIDRLNPILNCYITVCRDAALEQAEKLDRLLDAGVDLGPLHGIPVGIKDNIATKGIRTTAASRILADWIPTDDATVVSRIRNAGGVILGKLNMYEFAYGGVHDDFGETRNPWDRGRTCSASSSGPACAVAAGLAYASLGTDTGGSVRLPASAVGIVGLKPTYGLVSRNGVVPGGYSLDHVGPFARTVGDAATLLAAVAGPDPKDPAGSLRQPLDYLGALDRSIRGMRLGLPDTQPTELIDGEMAEAFRAAVAVLEREGAEIVPIDLPDHLVSRTVMWAISGAELAEGHRGYLRDRARDYSPKVAALIKQGAFLPATDYVHAQRVRQKIIDAYADIMNRVDAIAMPCAAFPAWPVGADDVTIAGRTETVMACLTRYCPPFNVTGQPAIAVPAGFNREGLPLGFQIAGRWHDEPSLLRLARAYERATDWHRRRPPLQQ